MKKFNLYFFICGLFAHIVLVVILLSHPVIIEKISNSISSKYYSWAKDRAYLTLTQGHRWSVDEEIKLTLEPWSSWPVTLNKSHQTNVNGVIYDDLLTAVSALQDGDELYIAAGTYQSPILITKNNITIKGNGHVVFEKKAARGKGFILSQGDHLIVENIECRHISVRDGNGACIRQEGVGLTLRHVYFHNSQQGVLETAKRQGSISIFDSRFERLGYLGQAHGIYTNKASLYIKNSVFIGTKSEGHAIKVRGEKLNIDTSIVASFSSKDSRLIDMPNGGTLSVKNSILAQGPNSSNGQAIGHGLEGVMHKNNEIKLTGNVIFLERTGVNTLLMLPKKKNKEINVIQFQNLIIGDGGALNELEENNYFLNREELGLPNYPYFPSSFCNEKTNCILKH